MTRIALDIDYYSIDNKSTEEIICLRKNNRIRTGKKIAIDFEQEVLIECKSRGVRPVKSDARNAYSYSSVRECAEIIRDKSYWDEASLSFVKKWKLDDRTCNLKFVNKWVTGLLKRNDLYRSSEEPSYIESNHHHQLQQQHNFNNFSKLMLVNCASSITGKSNFSVDSNDIIVHEVVELDASYDPAFDFINDLLLQTPSLDSSLMIDDYLSIILDDYPSVSL